MKRLYLIMAMVAFSHGCTSTLTLASNEDNCGLQAPPRDVPPEYINGMDGIIFFVYPKTLPANYTGCQIMWLNVDAKSAIHFSHGILTIAELCNNNKLIALCNF
jgi:hypothetical protein